MRENAHKAEDAAAARKRPPRVFLVGTDTDCGKTTLACALLRAGARAGLRVLPFKPAASGAPGPEGDPERLAAASDLGVTAAEICPLRYAEPLAPGIAADRGAFLRGGMIDDGLKDRVEETEPFKQVERALGALEARIGPDVTLIEGAGGLWVPMPGGTWLPGWIAGLGAASVVVGRLGLGAINHALLTIFALRRLGLPPRGFFLVDTRGEDDPAKAENPGIVAQASGVPCLGVLPHGEAREGWLAAGGWERMFEEAGSEQEADEEARAEEAQSRCLDARNRPACECADQRGGYTSG
ncbi:MAG TPA: ATP-dependent dethiobiotin synthetase BioD [Nannocystis sp.]